MSGGECGVEDCGKPVHKAELCRGHYARKRRGRVVSGPLRQWADPRRTLMEAAFAFADASESDDDAFLTAWKRLYEAARRTDRVLSKKGVARTKERDDSGRFVAR